MQYIKNIYIILLLLIAFSCSSPRPFEKDPICNLNPKSKVLASSQYLINGVATTKFPEVCKLKCKNSMCTATLIGSKTILTAAHCFGCGCKIKRECACIFKNSISINIIDYTKHEDSTIDVINDVAIGVLETSPNIEPAILTNSKPIVGDNILLLGFGRTKLSSGNPINPRYGCNVIEKVTRTEIHYSLNGKDAGLICYGDSGGPLYIDRLVSGVHSYFVSSNAEDGEIPCGKTVNADMRVDYYLDWILEHIKDDYIKIRNIRR